MASTEVNYDDLPNLPEHSWIVKVCEEYYDDYKDCKSIKAKFHQYFIHGETLDCSQWKKDYDACIKYREKKDIEGLQSVIDSEIERKKARLRAHYENDVWEKRTEPPPEWFTELPNKGDAEISFLGEKMEELKKKNLVYPNEESKTSCSIS